MEKVLKEIHKAFKDINKELTKIRKVLEVLAEKLNVKAKEVGDEWLSDVINIVDENNELIASISSKDIILKNGYKAIITSEVEKCFVAERGLKGGEEKESQS